MKQSGVVLQDDGARATPVLGFDVHIWRIALDTPISQMDLTALSPAELTRGSRFVFERDQRRYLAAHAALRTVLSVYIGQAPEELDLRRTSEAHRHRHIPACGILDQALIPFRSHVTAVCRIYRPEIASTSLRRSDWRRLAEQEICISAG
ncbi:MAG: hypothetical protein EOS26_11325 [Mesorhizobium sp.]|nr:MAG: hypothetical protein EOS26_11325 [Mesorhizobium sp.]